MRRPDKGNGEATVVDTTTKSNAKAAAKVDTVVGARTTTLTSPAAKATATMRSACVITVNGCVAVEGGLGVNAGADVDFFGLFNKDTTVPLFNKKFDLFKRCLGSGVASKKRAVPRASLAPLLSLKLDAMRKRALSRSSSNFAQAESLIEEVIEGDSIDAV